MTFYLMLVHNTYSSVSVVVWPPFGKELSTRLAVCSHCIFSILRRSKNLSITEYCVLVTDDVRHGMKHFYVCRHLQINIILMH